MASRGRCSSRGHHRNVGRVHMQICERWKGKKHATDIGKIPFRDCLWKPGNVALGLCHNKLEVIEGTKTLSSGVSVTHAAFGNNIMTCIVLMKQNILCRVHG